MKSGSNLEKVLTAGHFAVTAELGPPAGSDVDLVTTKAELLRGAVDAVNVTDNQTAVVRMSSVAVSALLVRMGIEPVMQMVCRDRNRIAMQSDIFGAAALGIRNLTCLTGDHQGFGNQSGAKKVYDIDSVQLVAMVKRMRDERRILGSDEEIAGTVPLFIGAAANPFAKPYEFRALRLAKKVEAGADYVQTQCVFDVAMFAEWMKAVRDLGVHLRCRILAGVTPLKSAGMARYMAENVPGIVIPETIIKRMSDAPKGKGPEAGLAICAEIIEGLRAIEGVAGIHIMAVEWEQKVREIVQTAKLLPDPWSRDTLRLMDTPQDDTETTLRTDELQEVVALCDADGIILSWNRAGEEITGFPREDVLGYHIDSVVSPDFHEVIDEVLSIQRFGSVLPGFSLRLQTRFGWEVPAEVTAVPRRIGQGEAGSLLIFRDVTLKSQLQEQLDRMDVLYRGLVENSPDLVYVLDANARLLFINDTVETLLGYPKRDIIGKELIELVHPEDRQRAYWPLRERRRSDRATRNLRLRLLTRDGSSRRYDLGFVYVSLDSIGLGHSEAEGRLPPDEHLGTQGVARDVTELVMLQEFSRQAELILPVCSVCRKIRLSVGGRDEWITLADYVERKTGVMYSHTYCPDHEPGIHNP